MLAGARLRLRLTYLLFEPIEPLADGATLVELLRQVAGVRTRAATEPRHGLIERAGNLAFGFGARAGGAPALSHVGRRRPHALADLLPLQVRRRLPRGRIARPGAALALRHRACRALERVDTVGEAVLFAREPAIHVAIALAAATGIGSVPGFAFFEPRGLVCNAALRIHQLLRLEPEVAVRALSPGGCACLQAPFHLSKLFGRPLGASGGGGRVLTLQFTRSIAHLIGRVPHLACPLALRAAAAVRAVPSASRALWPLCGEDALPRD